MNNKGKLGQTVVENRKPSAALMEAKKRARQVNNKPESNATVIDIYQNVSWSTCRLILFNFWRWSRSQTFPISI